MKEWLKSVLKYRSYPKNKTKNKTGYPFFGPPCIALSLWQSFKSQLESQVLVLIGLEDQVLANNTGLAYWSPVMEVRLGSLFFDFRTPIKRTRLTASRSCKVYNDWPVSGCMSELYRSPALIKHVDAGPGP